jgi:HEAT repeat protein
MTMTACRAQAWTVAPVLAAACFAAAASLAAQGRAAQEPSGPQPVTAAQLRESIDSLGKLDYDVRTAASRTVRRTPGAQAVPALLQAVSEHADGYVRYRALVLLTGFNDPRTLDAMRESLVSPNDRLRAVAYSFFERHPEPAMVAQLVGKLDTELAEFVRPMLVRALAAHGDDRRVPPVLIREARRGEDFFRSAVIEALGEHKAGYAFDTLTAIAKLDGPLQDDAALALGRIGDKRSLETLAELQRSAPQPRQPTIAAAICLLGVNCASHEAYLVNTLKFADENPGFQELLRAAAAGLGALAVGGRPTALEALFDIGIPSRDPTRAPVALATATVALRGTTILLPALDRHPKRAEAIALLADGFDMLEEDLEKERFFALVRRTYWASPEASSSRGLMQTLIGQLDF